MSKQREAFDALEGIHPGNMSKHTPGPWRVVDGFYPSVKEIKGPSFTITAVMWATDLTQKDYQNRHYDLRLIAAAPDLLEALESSLEEMKDDWITLDGEFGPFMQEFGDIESAIKEEHASTKTIRMAIAAIAKAKGEA